METNQEHTQDNFHQRHNERGNVLIYVLIAIALFAALSFTLSRQTDTGEAGTLDEERAGLVATQLISYATQAKSSYDQMEFSGSVPSSAPAGTSFADMIDFTRPDDPSGFNDATVANNIYKIYHPEGGGLIRGTLPDNAVDSSNIGAGLPDPGWYMGRFTDIDWSVPDPDITLVAYGISSLVCASINDKQNGSSTIPVMTEPVHEVFVPETYPWNGGTANNWTSGTQVTSFITDPGSTPICADCENVASLCVQGSDGVYGFYTIVAER